jgi:NAD(P)-dependent dehydrogenase (short-subunit alcohol dehydrogenase family)
MVELAVATFGRLDAVVNNAGFVRDRMFVSCTPEEWDAVLRVHLRGHFCTSRHAVDYWRAQQKAGTPIDARIINTTSGAGLQGSVGQSTYSAAKGGIATLTLVQAAELARYGITANALAPNARTRMTATGAFDMDPKEGAFDVFAPENTAPLVAYLVSVQSRGVTGQVFELKGGTIFLSQGWSDSPAHNKGTRLEAAELDPIVRQLVATREPAKPVYGAA